MATKEPKELSETVQDQSTGEIYDLFGDNLEELALQARELAQNGADLPGTIRVLNDNGAVVGWIDPNGNWRYARLPRKLLARDDGRADPPGGGPRGYVGRAAGGVGDDRLERPPVVHRP